MTKQADAFEHARMTLAACERELGRLKEDHDAMLEALDENLKRGRFSRLRYDPIRHGTIMEKIREFEAQWVKLRKQLPPFTLYEDGIFKMPPIKDEHRHLLKRS